MLLSNNISGKPNAHLISNLVQSSDSVAYIYNEYAPIIYDTILKITGDDVLGEEIFEEVFLDLHTKKMLVPEHPTLCHTLLTHTFKLTLKHL